MTNFSSTSGINDSSPTSAELLEETVQLQAQVAQLTSENDKLLSEVTTLRSSLETLTTTNVNHVRNGFLFILALILMCSITLYISGTALDTFYLNKINTLHEIEPLFEKMIPIADRVKLAKECYSLDWCKSSFGDNFWRMMFDELSKAQKK